MQLIMAVILVAWAVPTIQAAAPPAKLPLVQAGSEYEPGRFVGRIVSTIKNGIVIKPERGMAQEWDATLADGKRVRMRYEQDNTRPAREFTFDDCLFPDRPGPKSQRVRQHDVSEPQVGDVVKIAYRCVAGTALCTDITIIRRPNGKVPPAIHDEKTPAHLRHDTQCNAEQFIEEKVVPVTLPRLFRSIRP